MNQKQQKQTGGALFQKQNSGKPAPPPVQTIEEDFVDIEEKAAPGDDRNASGTVPVPVDTGAGGAIQHRDEAEMINDMFPVAANFLASGPEGLQYKRVGILKDTGQFSIESDDGEITENPKVIYCIPLAVTYPNALFLPTSHELSYKTSDSSFPDCYSLDGNLPVKDIYCEDCSRCKFNQWGSYKEFIKPDSDSNGKACKNMAAVAIGIIGHSNSASAEMPALTDEKILEILDGRITPLKIIFPPTSIKGFKAYIGTELGMRKRINMFLAVTKITLKTVDKPHKYSVAEFRFAGEIRTRIQEIMKKAPDAVESLRKYKLFTADNAAFLAGNIVFEREDVEGPEDAF